MKTHARNFTIGGLLVPLALALATLIANEAQTLIGLHLDNVALAIYLLPFLAGAALAIQALFKLEMSRIVKAFTDNFAQGFDGGLQGKPADESALDALRAHMAKPGAPPSTGSPSADAELGITPPPPPPPPAPERRVVDRPEA